MDTLRTDASDLTGTSERLSVYDPNEDYFAVDPAKMAAALSRLKRFVLHQPKPDGTATGGQVTRARKSTHRFA